jgi:hypothetical protein
MESTLENKLTRATTMLVNGAEELRGQVGKARSTIARGSTPSPPEHASFPAGQSGDGPMPAPDPDVVSLPGVFVDSG